MERVLYMAIEVNDNLGMLGLTTGFDQRPRERSLVPANTMAFEPEIRSAKWRFRLP